MKKKHFSAVKVLAFTLFLGLSFSAHAQSIKLGDKLMSKFLSDTTFQISKNVKEIHLHYLNAAGDSMSVYIVKAKLRKNKLSLEAAAFFKKDSFYRKTVRSLLKRENTATQTALAGINAGFFNMRTGVPTQMTIVNNKILKNAPASKRDFVGIQKNGKVIMGDAALLKKKKDKLSAALGAYPLLIKKGHILPQTNSSFSTTRHPRTALGTIHKRKIILVVVDGRQPSHGNGMPLEELALLMKTLGAKNAINLDGGGSSTLISIDSSHHKWIIRNSPSGGIQRPVSNAWVLVKHQ